MTSALLAGCSSASDAVSGAAGAASQLGVGGATAQAGAAPSGGAGAASAASGGPSGGASSGGASASGGDATGGGNWAGAGGAVSFGGSAGASGASAMGGASAGAGGGAQGSTGPCDIYAAASTPCVAAHSTVRALFGAYKGPLYQLRRASDKATKDVPVSTSSSFADTSVQDSFCNGTTCTVSILYDQTSNKNDLVKSPVAHWLPDGGVEANAANGKITVGGHTVHGIYVTANSNVAYRNNATKGVAKGDQAESMYMVLDGKRYSSVCCFDYGNAETSGNDDGNGTMEAVYWGTDITWGGKGDGAGPWIAADLENGMFKGDKGGWQSQSITTPGAKSVIASFATAMLKGRSGNHFTLKAGDAQNGSLVTMWNGARPAPGYSPKKLQGAIILGTGGDGSNGGTGTFFEGAVTSGVPPDSVDDAVHANVIAQGYGR
ncbi:MAG: arabinofuranosidase catalytic domain-containing protein [Myxococcales bacterium]